MPLQNKTTILAMAIMLCSLLTACKKDEITYAEQLKAHNKLIEQYIKREGITIIDNSALTDPDYKWGEKQYVKTSTGLYYHLIAKGEGDTVRTGDIVTIRYKQRTLHENAITEEYWTTQDSPYPTEVSYNVNAECLGWNEAIGYMKRSGAHCSIIVPYDLGFSAAQTSLEPYYFELKIKFHY